MSENYVKGLVSVIVPSYNYAGYLPETLISLLSQDYAPMEIIVVDDGSTDDTPQVMEPFRDSGKIIHIRQENKGLPGARNTGIREAKGEFLYFIDADDLIMEGTIKALAEALEKEPNAGVAFGGKQFFHEGGVYETSIPSPATYSGNCFSPLVTEGNPISIGAALVRRDCLDKAGSFSEEMKSIEDYEFWLRMAYRFPFICIRKPLVKIRKHQSNMSHDRHLPRMFESEIYALEKALSMIEERQDAEGSALIKGRIRNRRIRLALEYFRIKKYNQGKEILNQLSSASGSDAQVFIMSRFPVIVGWMVSLFKSIQGLFYKWKPVKKE